MTEHDELLAIEEALEKFARTHGSDYFCAIIMPDESESFNQYRHSIFKRGLAGEGIEKTVREILYFNI
jgi:hypothetical protein